MALIGDKELIGLEELIKPILDFQEHMRKFNPSQAAKSEEVEEKTKTTETDEKLKSISKISANQILDQNFYR